MEFCLHLFRGALRAAELFMHVNFCGVKPSSSFTSISTIVLHIFVIAVDFSTKANGNQDLLGHNLKRLVPRHVHTVTAGVTDRQSGILPDFFITRKIDLLLCSWLETRSAAHKFEQKLSVLVFHLFDHLPEHIFHLAVITIFIFTFR